jgi:hypothetical protein
VDSGSRASTGNHPPLNTWLPQHSPLEPQSTEIRGRLGSALSCQLGVTARGRHPRSCDRGQPRYRAGKASRKSEAFLQEEDASPGRGNGGGRRNVGVIFSPFCDLFPLLRAYVDRRPVGQVNHQPAQAIAHLDSPPPHGFTPTFKAWRGTTCAETLLHRSPPGSAGVTLL